MYALDAETICQITRDLVTWVTLFRGRLTPAHGTRV